MKTVKRRRRDKPLRSRPAPALAKRKIAAEKTDRDALFEELRKELGL